MNVINLLSTLAMAVGLAAALPQILRMLRTRSSGGQSVLGWGMGLVTNLSMAYVNLFGFHAAALMASNVLSAVLCVAAIVLIMRFGDAGETAARTDGAPLGLIQLRTVPAPAPIHPGVFSEMPTTEFVALREAVLTAQEHRAQQAAEPAPELLAHAA